MRKWFQDQDQIPEVFDSMVDGLASIYAKKLRPLENACLFSEFESPLLEPSDIKAKPMVLILGQYSTGKTTMVNYLLDREYPSAHVSPEPTTDRFFALMHGKDDRVTPGHAACVQPSLPFQGLQQFGSTFLQKFEVDEINSPILENMILIDTPGVLSGEKQSIGRKYDFPEVCRWFAERSDLILLVFDAHKLDISDELKTVVDNVRCHSDKLRIVLNKADQVNPQQLMRVYGALMWSLSKVLGTPEVSRVFVSSFWSEPHRFKDNANLFQAELKDLLRDLHSLPRNSAVRRINEIVKRTRLVKVYVHLIAHFRSEMPQLFGKDKKQWELIANLDQVFEQVLRFTQVSVASRLPLSDFPDIDKLRRALAVFCRARGGLGSLKKIDLKLVEVADSALSEDFPQLFTQFREWPEECAAAATVTISESPRASVNGTTLSLSGTSPSANGTTSSVNGTAASVHGTTVSDHGVVDPDGTMPSSTGDEGVSVSTQPQQQPGPETLQSSATELNEDGTLVEK